MADERIQIAVPRETDKVISELSERLDETKGKIVKIAVQELAKKVLK